MVNFEVVSYDLFGKMLFVVGVVVVVVEVVYGYEVFFVFVVVGGNDVIG